MYLPQYKPGTWTHRGFGVGVSQFLARLFHLEQSCFHTLDSSQAHFRHTENKQPLEQQEKIMGDYTKSIKIEPPQYLSKLKQKDCTELQLNVQRIKLEVEIPN